MTALNKLQELEDRIDTVLKKASDNEHCPEGTMDHNFKPGDVLLRKSPCPYDMRLRYIKDWPSAPMLYCESLAGGWQTVYPKHWELDKDQSWPETKEERVALWRKLHRQAREDLKELEE